MEIINFNLRISEELNEKLIKIAEEQGRSKNKQIEQILKEYVKDYERHQNSISINQEHNNEATVNINNKINESYNLHNIIYRNVQMYKIIYRRNKGSKRKK